MITSPNNTVVINISKDMGIIFCLLITVMITKDSMKISGLEKLIYAMLKTATGNAGIRACGFTLVTCMALGIR